MNVDDLPDLGDILTIKDNKFEVINVKNLKTPLKPEGTYYVVELRLK